jgi:hypothetical protein
MAAPKSSFDDSDIAEFKRVFASFDTDGDQFIDEKVDRGARTGQDDGHATLTAAHGSLSQPSSVCLCVDCRSWPVR